MRRNIIPYEYYHDLDKKIKSKLIRAFQRDNTYRNSSKETRGSYSYSEGPNAGLIRILLNFCIFAYCFLSFLRVLLECGSYSRAGLFRGFTVSLMAIIFTKFHEDRAKIEDFLVMVNLECVCFFFAQNLDVHIG